MATGDGSFATESTYLWIFASMNLYVEVCVLFVVWCGVWLYIPHFILMTRKNMYFQGIFCGSLLVSFFTLFLVLLGFLFKSWLQLPHIKDQQGPVLNIGSPYYDSALSAYVMSSPFQASLCSSTDHN